MSFEVQRILQGSPIQEDAIYKNALSIVPGVLLRSRIIETDRGVQAYQQTVSISEERPPGVVSILSREESMVVLVHIEDRRIPESKWFDRTYIIRALKNLDGSDIPGNGREKLIEEVLSFFAMSSPIPPKKVIFYWANKGEVR